ncbi:MAG: type VI secretion system contractile sheath large subunit [Deltaproteobacteria bacterium]|jgi:type VI secretion system protein ImpC|nr:type VI secretion system contractile sheath large subunit [Deltaproteobacteria bacterium]
MTSYLEDLTADLSEEDRAALVTALSFALPLNPCLEDPGRAVLELDGLIAGLDTALSRQLDEILHHQAFQDVERTWRSPKYLVDGADRRENVEVHILDATHTEIYEDLTEAPEITRSSMFRKIYSLEYGQFGGQPFGAVIGAYELGSGPEDLALMRNMARLGALAHAPFMVSVRAGFFGMDNWGDLTAVQDLEAILSQPHYSAWQSLRTQENSRYLVLVLPGFLARVPYSPRSKIWPGFNYLEKTEKDNAYVWGYSSVLIGLLMARSFAK